MSKIFVTGGTGFIGSHFLQRAAAKGYSLRAVRREGSHPRIPLDNEPEWLHHSSLAEIPRSSLEGCHTLVHLASAGVIEKSSWQELYRVNVTESIALWLDAISAGVARLIICGSCFEYGAVAEQYDYIPADAPLRPVTPYAASKAAASLAALTIAIEKQVEVIIARPFHTYGPGEALPRFWPALCQAAESGADFPMTIGDQVRDFTPVELVADVLTSLVESKEVSPGRPLTVNIGTGKAQSLAEFAAAEWTRLGAKGSLLRGAVPHRKDEVMRYVPETNHRHL